MRTKKVLSILLVMIMALGLLGIVGASAEELVDEEEVIVALAAEEEEVAVVAAAPVLAGEEEAVAQADKGWNPADEIKLYENRAHTKGSGAAEIRWDCFLADGDATPKKDSFYTLYEAKKATFEWQAERNVKTAAGTDDWKALVVQDNLALANATTGVYWGPLTATTLTLTIGQAAAVKWYGEVRARLRITVDGVTSDWSEWKVADLVDTKKLAEKINDANDELDKASRHTEKYIDNLKAVLNVVNAVYSTQKLSNDDVNKYIVYLEFALAGKNAIGEPVGNIWKLADKNGDGFIDKLLGQSFISFIWRVIDVYNTAMLFINPMIDFFGEIGNFFGYLMPFFGLFTGLLGF